MLPDGGIVAGGDELAVEGIRALQQGAPLDMGVAEHARVGGAAGEVFVYEVFDHKGAEFIADVENIMRKAVLHGGHTGVVERIEVAAAGFFFGSSRGGIV